MERKQTVQTKMVQIEELDDDISRYISSQKSMSLDSGTITDTEYNIENMGSLSVEKRMLGDISKVAQTGLDIKI